MYTESTPVIVVFLYIIVTIMTYGRIFSMNMCTALTKQVVEKYSLPVKSAFSAGRGFHLQLYTAHSNSCSGLTDKGGGGGEDGGGQFSSPCIADLPGEFIKVTKQRSTLSFTTVDFIKLNSELRLVCSVSMDECLLNTN